jgi:hypothetical protein
MTANSISSSSSFSTPSELPKAKRRPANIWTNDECVKLSNLVKQYGKNWEKISQEIKTKNPEQCRFKFTQRSKNTTGMTRIVYKESARGCLMYYQTRSLNKTKDVFIDQQYSLKKFNKYYPEYALTSDRLYQFSYTISKYDNIRKEKCLKEFLEVRPELKAKIKSDRISLIAKSNLDSNTTSDQAPTTVSKKRKRAKANLSVKVESKEERHRRKKKEWRHAHGETFADYYKRKQKSGTLFLPEKSQTTSC